MDKIEKIRKAATIVDKNGKPKTKLKKTRKPRKTPNWKTAVGVNRKNKTNKNGRICKTEYSNDKLDEENESVANPTLRFSNYYVQWSLYILLYFFRVLYLTLDLKCTIKTLDKIILTMVHLQIKSF